MNKIKYFITLTSIALVVVIFSGLSYADDDYIYLQIMYTNDTHGGIAPSGAWFMNPEFPPPLGGWGSLAEYIKIRREDMKDKGAHSLLLDAGDCFTGTPIGTKTEGMAVINAMNMLGYDAMAIGNHEFDKGYWALEKMIKTANFPIMAANIIDSRTGKKPDHIKGYFIRDFGDLKVGIVGIGLTASPDMALPDNIGNYDFLPEERVIADLVPDVRSQCDVLIVLTHMFLPYDPVEGWAEVEKRNEEGDPTIDGMGMHAANLFSGIDLMFTGHVHRGYYEPWEDPINHTIMCQTYGNGSGVGEIVLKIDKKTKTIAGYDLPSESGGLVTLFEDQFPPDNEVAEYIAKEQAIAEEGMDDPIGSTRVKLVRGGAAESIIGRMIMDAFRAYYDSDFSFSNVGGVRSEIPVGDITLRQLFMVMPFGNQLVRMQVKGSFIRKIVEQKLLSDNSDRGILTAGAEIIYNKTRPQWDRVTKFLIRGEPLDPDRIYDVVTTDYLSEGNSGLEILLEIPRDEKEYTQIPDIDVVAKYITENSPINIKPDTRFKRDDNSEQAPYLDQALYQ